MKYILFFVLSLLGSCSTQASQLPTKRLIHLLDSRLSAHKVDDDALQALGLLTIADVCEDKILQRRFHHALLDRGIDIDFADPLIQQISLFELAPANPDEWAECIKKYTSGYKKKRLIDWIASDLQSLNYDPEVLQIFGSGRLAEVLQDSVLAKRLRQAFARRNIMLNPKDYRVLRVNVLEPAPKNQEEWELCLQKYVGKAKKAKNNRVRKKLFSEKQVHTSKSKHSENIPQLAYSA